MTPEKQLLQPAISLRFFEQFSPYGYYPLNRAANRDKMLINAKRAEIGMREPADTLGADNMIVTLRVSDLRSLIREELAMALSGGNRTTESGELLTLKDAAKYLNQSDSWLYRRWKEIGGKKLGGNIRFAKADIEKFIAKKGA